MDAGRYDPVRYLLKLGAGSLLQYLSEASPWFPRESADIQAKIMSLASEERDEVARLTRWLQKQRERVPVLGSYPSYFTTMNFVTLDFILPKLVAENVREVAELERVAVHAEGDEEIRRLIQGYLEMKRNHLTTLQGLTATTV